MLIDTEIEPVGDGGELYKLKIFDGEKIFESSPWTTVTVMSTNELLRLRKQINEVCGYAVRED